MTTPCQKEAGDFFARRGSLAASQIVGDRSDLFHGHLDWGLHDREGKPLVRLLSYTEPQRSCCKKRKTLALKLLSTYNNNEIDLKDQSGHYTLTISGRLWNEVSDNVPQE